jgi:hypothetical protein
MYGGFVVPVVKVLLSHLVEYFLLLSSTVSAVTTFFSSLACGLSFGKLSTSPYDRDQTLEI